MNQGAAPRLAVGGICKLRVIELAERQELPVAAGSGLFRVLSGVLQTSVIAEDGRRWISAFHLEGELIWLDRASVRSQIAEALCPSSLAIVDGSMMQALLSDDDAISAAARGWLLRSYSVSHRWGFLLARSNAVEKLSFFLIDMMNRLDGRSDFSLLMSRADIGDHLGLTSETVTRTFTHLQRSGCIAVRGKEVSIVDRPRLLFHAGDIVST
ncbi:MAG: helix-turn-helix domain-containing protein [Pseudomonadota bacterium]|nr:MAG: hypothetical protein ABT11_19400 [Novosphingobium sp. SCN 66-18]